MAHLKASSIIITCIILIVASASLENKESEAKLKQDEVLPSIVTKIVRRGLVPKRSRLAENSTAEVVESGEYLTET